MLAKADRATAPEIAEARRFTTRAIAEAVPALDVGVYEVSAREVLAADLPTREWTRMTHALEQLAQRDGANLIARARERETATLTARTRSYLDEVEGALTRPVAETEARVKTLTEAARAADRAVMELRHRFDAEQQQIDRELEARLARLVQDNRLAVHAEIAKRLTSQPTRADALRLAQQVAEATIHSWRDFVTPEIDVRSRGPPSASSRAHTRSPRRATPLTQAPSRGSTSRPCSPRALDSTC